MAIKKISANLLGNNAVTAASIAGGAISAADIADNSITAAKLSASTSPTFGGLTVNGTVTSDGLTLNNEGNEIKLKSSSSQVYGLLKTGDTVSTNALEISNGNAVVLISDTNDSQVTGGADATLISRGSSATKTALFDVNGDISFYEDTGTTAKLFWDASEERLGIGTNTPTTAKLHVEGDGIAIKLDGTANTTRSIFFRNVTDSNPATIYADGSLKLYTEDANTDIRFSAIRDIEYQSTSTNSTAGHHIFKSYNTEIMRMDGSNNRVGIGEPNPSYPLHVVGRIYSTTDVQGGSGIIKNDATYGATFGSNSSAVGIAIARDAAPASYPDLIINSSGNVGIGRTSPSAKLDVNGSMKVDNIQLQDSSVLGIGTVGATSSVGHTASTNEGIFWHTSQTDYGIFRTAGSWVGTDYQQLKMSWDTGIILDGGSNYGQSGISFRGNNTQRMLVSPAGNVMIGTGSPTSRLHVDSGTFAGYAVDLVQGGSGGGNHGLRIVSASGSSYTLIARANASTVFYVDGAGNYYFSGSNQSDVNKKENIADLTDNALDLITQLQPKTYNFIGSDIDKAGFIAQEMEQVIPRLVSGNEFDPDAADEDGNNPTGKGIDYMGYTAYLTKAIQEQQTLIDALQARLDSAGL